MINKMPLDALHSRSDVKRIHSLCQPTHVYSGQLRHPPFDLCLTSPASITAADLKSVLVQPSGEHRGRGSLLPCAGSDIPASQRLSPALTTFTVPSLPPPLPISTRLCLPLCLCRPPPSRRLCLPSPRREGVGFGVLHCNSHRPGVLMMPSQPL